MSFWVLVAVVMAALVGGTHTQDIPVAYSEVAGSVYGPGRGRIFTVAFGHDYGAHEYIDETGYVVGFSRDFVRAACLAAGIQCRLVWDRYTNCWRTTAGSHSFGGQGLFNGYYDACAGWWTTLDRIHVFDFTIPYLRKPKSYFYVRPGGSFDVKNLKGKNIGFMEGWATDEKCVARQSDIEGRFLHPDPQVVHVADVNEAVAKLNSGAIHAFFSAEEAMSAAVKDNRVDKIDTKSFDCFIAGNAMMTRKGSDFVPWFNFGYQMLRSNGKMAEMCRDGRVEHGKKGTIDCLDG